MTYPPLGRLLWEPDDRLRGGRNGLWIWIDWTTPFGHHSGERSDAWIVSHTRASGASSRQTVTKKKRSMPRLAVRIGELSLRPGRDVSPKITRSRWLLRHRVHT
jgi:hypothetical protein